MSRKKKQTKETTIENYYDLKTKEMDELVAALKEGTQDNPVSEQQPDLKQENQQEQQPQLTYDIKEITGEEVKSKRKKAKNFDPYKRDMLSALPVPVKAIFIKWWFAGCVCYFFMMGLGIDVASLDRLAINGLVLGVVNELLVNPLFRFLESDKKEYNAYMMFPFPFKAYWTFLTNIIYYCVVVIGVGYLYVFVNLSIAPTGVEPLLFGTFSVIVDMVFIGIKDLIVFIVKRHKKIDREEEVNV